MFLQLCCVRSPISATHCAVGLFYSFACVFGQAHKPEQVTSHQETVQATVLQLRQCCHRPCSPKICRGTTGPLHENDSTPSSAQAVRQECLCKKRGRSTKVTPAENVIICLGKKVFWLFGLLTWIVDRDYMSISRCYDIPKKLLSTYDCNKISHGRVHQNLCVAP